LALAVTGVAIGVVTAALLTRFISSLLYGVGTLDVTTYVGVASILLAVAVLASYLPARRAARVDPSWRCDMDEVLRVVEKSEDYAPVERQ
jgi:ABC-type antimicrobial peptide transport system permease subunit